MSYRGIDQYGDKTGIATRDQLKKAKILLEPIKVSLQDHGVELPSKEDLQDLTAIRSLLIKTQETLKHMTDKASKLEGDRGRLQAKFETLNHRFPCPYLQGATTFFDCQKSCTGGYCPQGWHCESRIKELKKFLLLP